MNVQKQLEQSVALEEDHDRSKYLGSSETAAILGISPWKTAYDVWESKQEWFSPEPLSEEQEKRFKRGKRLEPVIIDQYQEETGEWITARNSRYYDEEFPFLTCEIDAEETDEQTGEITNLEVKSVAVFDAHNWGPSGTDEVPAYYAAQVMKNLMVSGRNKAKVIALIGLDDLRVYILERDEEVIAAIRDKEVSFWMNHVVTGIPPAIQSKEDAIKMISKLSGVTVEADDHVRNVLDRILQLKREMKSMEREQSALELEVMKALAHGADGEPDKALLVDAAGNKLASWNLTKRDGYTVKPTSYRVLRITAPKGDAA